MRIAITLLTLSAFIIRSHQEERLAYQLDCDVENHHHELAGWSAHGDDESLNELFGKSIPRLIRVADCILHNYHDSEDALQDGLLSALRHIDQFKGNARFSTWLFSIVRNSALAKLRKQRAHPAVSIDEHGSEDDVDSEGLGMPTDPGPDPERSCAQAELSYRFAQTLEELPANYRAIIRLCDFEGFSGREAARQLGLTVSALKAQHHRARLALRESMSAQAARRDGYRGHCFTRTRGSE
jgi:RNA polymerase sigma-70 factor, ECF subfamily